jgi:hypothetical protein
MFELAVLYFAFVAASSIACAAYLLMSGSWAGDRAAHRHTKLSAPGGHSSQQRK